MDPKTIEMNNLRALNDYLNQTIDALARQPRLGQHTTFGFSPFASIPSAVPGLGTDAVYGPWFGSSVYGQTPYGHPQFAAQTPFAGLPVYGAGYGSVDPFYAQRSFAASTFGGWQQPWTPAAEMSRTAQLCQAVCARQSVLEAACRACGIPV